MILDESLFNEAFSIGDGMIASVSGYDALNWLEDQDDVIRILYDSNIQMYLMGDGNRFIHIDLFRAALDSNLYKFPFKYTNFNGEELTADDQWEMECYREDGEGLISTIFAPYVSEENDDNFREDSYAVRYDIPRLGCFYFRDNYDCEAFDDSDLYDELLKRYHNIEMVPLK